MAVKKSKALCPITREEFRQTAKVLRATIGGVELLIDTKEFSTGSLGWNANQKLTVELVPGKRVTCQLGLNLTIIGSKELPQ